MEDKDLRDFFAAMAMIGLVMRNGMLDEIGDIAYEVADNLLAARAGKKEGGIVSITRTKRK